MSGEYMHIDYRPPSAGGITSLWTRLNQSPSVVLRQRWENLLGTDTSELALAFLTKLEMLREVIRKLDHELGSLGDSLSSDTSGEIDECIAENYAYTLTDARLAYRLVADLDSFLYHTKSACEVMAKFALAFFRDILGHQPGVKAVKKEYFQYLADSGVDMSWYQSLEELRNLFIHNTAPWISVRRIASDPPKFEPILLKRNIQTFENPDDWVELEEYRCIYRGFLASLPVFNQWLVSKIQAFENEEEVVD